MVIKSDIRKNIQVPYCTREGVNKPDVMLPVEITWKAQSAMHGRAAHVCMCALSRTENTVCTTLFTVCLH